MRWLRGVAALAAMLAVIIGAPVALIGWGGPGPGWWRAGDGSLLLTILVVAGWLAWLVFTASTVIELVRYFSGNRFVVNLPLIGGLQALCAGLVLAVVALAATSAQPVAERTPSGHPARSPSPSASTAAVTATPAPSQAATSTHGAPREAAAVVQTRAHPAPEATAPGTGYLVRPGDDLWSIAEQLLGDGRRWRELARANPETLADPTRQLPAGTRLSVPAEPGVETVRAVSGDTRLSVPAEPDAERIRVVAGDTLSELALDHLGKAALWPRIAAANEDLIEDPDHIEVGWQLVIPEPPRKLSNRSPADEPHDHDQRAEPTPAPQTPSVAPAPGQPTPVSDGSTPAPGEQTSAPDPPTSGEVLDEARPQPDLGLLGTLSVLAAAGLMGGWQARRLLQHRSRQPGRRVAQPIDELARFQAALGRHQARDLAAALDSALREIGRHHHRAAQPLPALAQVVLSPDLLRFQWAEPAGPPPEGFDGDATAWLFDLSTPAGAAPDQPWHPCPYPALVSLGTMPGGETVLVDLERSGVLGVAGESAELRAASLASMALELGCVPWAAELSVVTVAGDPGLARAAVGETVSWVPDAATAIARLRARHAARTEALAGLDLRRLRTDPDLAEAVSAEVFVFREPLSEADCELLDRLLTGSRLGLSAVVPAPAGADAEWELFGDPLRPSGRLSAGEPLVAHAIPEATRQAVESLYGVADSVQTEPAPWWDEEPGVADPADDPDEESVEIVKLRRLTRPHPAVMLIGPIDLTGAAGPEPGRARQQLIEMCTWLVENPGRTATEMAAGLGIAESTRRSNMSRLRSWLGADPNGQPYLPDAYSGRIQLQAEVTSDLQRLRLLTGPGVNRIGESGLVAALDLVRGDLLADAAPGQWYWAEELRSDASSTLRDAGLVLVDQALARGDIDLARWAAGRALVVAPEDELLLCARIRTEHAAGDRTAVERHVLRLSQQARALGVDLMPETVMLCQQVMEGRPRARRA